MDSVFCVAGDIVGDASAFACGVGTYTREGLVRASLAGFVHIVPPKSTQDESSKTATDESETTNAKPIIQVKTSKSSNANASVNKNADSSVKSPRKRSAAIVPKANDIVYGRVRNVMPRLASIDIYAVGDCALTTPFSGVIRAHDTYAADGKVALDEVRCDLCFQIHDIVCARVLSLGDTRNVYLSTAEDSLGVVRTKRRAAVLDDATAAPEHRRKVARVSVQPK